MAQAEIRSKGSASARGSLSGQATESGVSRKVDCRLDKRGRVRERATELKRSEEDGPSVASGLSRLETAVVRTLELQSDIARR